MHRSRSTPAASPHGPSDIGTLWTLQRLGCIARCAVIALKGEWDLRVFVDDQILLTERSARGDGAFMLAEQWRRRLLDQGWSQVRPAPTAAGARSNRATR